MSESEDQSNQSPLLSDRGVTTISDSVVTQLAGMAAQEVEGVHMGGGASRTASGVLGSITGSESKTSGVSAEVGRTETAIDLKMGIEYNRNILQTVEEVRQRITERIEEMTGLRIKELNATITDITFPEKEQRRRLGPARPAGDRDTEQDTEETRDTSSEAQTAPESEPAEEEIAEVETVEVEATEVEPTSSTDTEAAIEPVTEEEVSVEGRTLEEDETAEVRVEEETTEVYMEEQTDEAPVASGETPAETETTPEAGTEAETPEPETPEARMRRRAEERARRRRRRSQDS